MKQNDACATLALLTPEAVRQLTQEVGLKFYEDYLKKIAE